MIPYQERLLADRHDRRRRRRRTSTRPSRADEIDYLSRSPTRISRGRSQRADVVWTYSGVRPLYDDGSADPSAVTRDYVLKLDAGDGGAARRCCRSSAARSPPTASWPSTRSTELSAVLSADEGARGRATARCPAAICRRAASPRGRRELRRAYPALPAEVRARRRPPPRHARAAVLGDARTRRIWARISATGSRARSRLSRARRMGAHRRRRAVAAEQVRPRHAGSRRSAVAACVARICRGSGYGDRARDAAAGRDAARGSRARSAACSPTSTTR